MEFTLNSLQVHIRHNLGVISPSRLEVIKEILLPLYPVEGTAQGVSGREARAFSSQHEHVIFGDDHILLVSNSDLRWQELQPILTSVTERLTFDITGFTLVASGIINSDESFSRSLRLLDSDSSLTRIPSLAAVGLRLFVGGSDGTPLGELKVEPLLGDRKSTYVEYTRGSLLSSSVSNLISSCRLYVEELMSDYVPRIIEDLSSR